MALFIICSEKAIGEKWENISFNFFRLGVADKMRKFSIALCVLAIVFVFCACKNNNETASSAEETNLTTEVSIFEDNIAALREYAPYGSDISVTAEDGKVIVSVSFDRNPVTQKSIEAMAKGIYFSKVYCDSAFDDYKLKYCICDMDSISVPLIWESVFGEWGTIIDNRGSETKVSTFDNLSKFCEFFPTVSKDINLSLLDQEDARIYTEVMDALDSRPNDSEEKIYEEFAQKYSMTSQQLYVFMKDVMEKVYSKSTDFEPETPLVYPSFTESSGFGWYPMAPDIVYSTPASENGLGDSYYSFIGTVSETGSLDNSGTEMQYFILDTQNGPVLVYDIYGWAMIHSPELNEIYPEPSSDYSFPNVNDYVKVYGVYQGYSDMFDMPSCIYGIPEFIAVLHR